MVFIRDEIGAAGGALLFGKEFAVGFSALRVARAASSLARFAFLRFWGCSPEKSKSMIFSPINTVTSRVTAPAIHNAVERLICFPLYRRLRRPLFCSSGKISSGVLPKRAQVMPKVRKPPTTMAMQYRRKSTGLPSGATL